MRYSLSLKRIRGGYFQHTVMLSSAFTAFFTTPADSIPTMSGQGRDLTPLILRAGIRVVRPFRVMPPRRCARPKPRTWQKIGRGQAPPLRKLCFRVQQLAENIRFSRTGPHIFPTGGAFLPALVVRNRVLCEVLFHEVYGIRRCGVNFVEH